MGNSKKSNNSIKYSLIIAVIFGVISVVLQKPAESWNYDVSSIALSILISLLSFIATYVLLLLFEYHKNNKIILDKLVNIEQKFEKAIEMVAVNSDGNVFENKLKLLREKEGGIKWIVAKFISKQLSVNFEHLGFNIDSRAYSEFSNELYKEADNCIYLTNSLNPYEWFKNLFTDSEFEEILIPCIKGINSWDEKYTPAHIKSWNNIHEIKPAVDRKRLIVLSNYEMENLFAYEPYFYKYNEINKVSDENTRYTTYDNLQKICPQLELNRYDYAIFDEHIALEWGLPNEKDKNQFIRLVDLKSDDKNARHITNFKDYLKKNWNTFIKAEDLKLKIKKKKSEIINLVKENKELHHKYCYHAFGGDSWKAINNDPDYSLGQREQEFLNKILNLFIKPEILKDNDYDIIHLGCGSGIEIDPIVKRITQSQKDIENYSLIDISSNMLERAKERVENLKSVDPIYDKINFKYLSADILVKEWKHKRTSKNPLIIILVCNGFLFSHDILLTKIASILDKNDFLIVTTEMQNLTKISQEDIKASYLIDSTIKLFNISLNLIGIDCIDQQYYKFNFDDDLFVGYFLFKKWADNNEDRKKMDLPDEIKIFQSYKPRSEQKIEERLHKFNLDIKDKDIDEEYNSIGLLIEKK